MGKLPENTIVATWVTDIHPYSGSAFSYLYLIYAHKNARPIIYVYISL